MGAMRCALALSALLLATTIAHADEPDAGATDSGAPLCLRAPDHDKGMKMWREMSKEIELFGRVTWPTRRTLDAWKSGAVQVGQAAVWLTCDHPAFSAKETSDAVAFEAKAAKWSTEAIARLDTEEKARNEVVLPLCNAVWDALFQEQLIAHERANPSGVVDLRVLHDAGEQLAVIRAQIAALKPLYARARGHAFTKWQDEGACVEAEAKARAEQ